MTSDLIQLDNTTLLCQGEWSHTELPELEALLQKIIWPAQNKLTIDGGKIKKMDTSGAWLLNEWIKKLKNQYAEINLQNFSEQQHALITYVEKYLPPEKFQFKSKTLTGLAAFGKNVWQRLVTFQQYLAFVGRLTTEAIRITFRTKHFRWDSLASTIYRTGFQALPIIALLSFMIGVVIAYQMGVQLRNYGANIFIVDLLGLSILREFGPLLTAIMIAGRTGSSFTAQLGIMKINQEIDALNTMGVTPGELLLLPRIIGLTIALPLLTIWSDIFGVLGGMLMAKNMLNITFHEFVLRFQHEIPLRALLIGIGKAPIFALIIASIGCFQGMQVEGSADSVGKNTTRSVVLGIFFIILADAIFSIILSKLRL